MYMKVAQNDETNPNTQPVRPPHIPSIANTQLSPSDSSIQKRETPGIFSRMFPPFTSITSYCVRSSLAPRIAMLCFVLLCLLCYLLCSPLLLLSGRPRDRFRYPRLTTVLTTTSLPEQPGKPPLDHQISPTLLYIACIRVV